MLERDIYEYINNVLSEKIKNKVREELDIILKEEFDNRIRLEVKSEMSKRLRELGRIE